MSFGFMGCRPAQVWPDPVPVGEPKPPPLGTEGQAKGNVYKLVRANEAITQYAACFVYGDHGVAEAGGGTNGEHLGIAQTAIPSGSTGWILVEGEGRVLTNAGAAAGDNHNITNNGTITATGGSNQPDTVGLTLFGNRSQGSTACRVNRPFLDTR